MPTAEVISDGVVQSGDKASDKVNVMASREKPNFPQTKMHAMDA